MDFQIVIALGGRQYSQLDFYIHALSFQDMTKRTFNICVHFTTSVFIRYVFVISSL